MNTNHLRLLRQFHDNFNTVQWTHAVISTAGNARAAQHQLEQKGANVVCLDAHHNLIGIAANARIIPDLLDTKLYPEGYSAWTDHAKQKWASKNKPTPCCDAIYSRKEVEQLINPAA